VLYTSYTHMRNEVKEGVADQCANAKAKHQIEDVPVRSGVTELDNEQSTARDDGDDEH